MFWFKDSRCPKRFPTMTQRERHWWDAHWPVKNCEVCGKSFPTNKTYLLKQHLQKCHPDGNSTDLPESALKPINNPEKTAAPVSPSQFDIPDVEIPPQTPEKEPVEPLVRHMYKNLHSDPSVFFAGAISSHHTGDAADLQRPIRNQGKLAMFQREWQ
ncbi:hypothetical protein CHS0354_016410 [Potamilus streckersoni]|uniref:Uncharacterized protein n=1 Tax=Potamilus streckersoni TaxID=2493646 RepID=A0AAE0SWD9_9BIVA|nr:hypothetical protein CHS0354_016410 [Potamilus streckersoni]